MLAVIHLADMKGFTLEQHEIADVVDFWWVSSTRLLYTQGVHDSNYDVPLADGQLYAVNADGSGRNLLYGYASGNPYYGAAELISVIPDDPRHALIAVDNVDAATSDGVLPLAEKMDVITGKLEKISSSPTRNAGFVADHKGNLRFAYADDNDDNIKVYSRAADSDDWQLMPVAGSNRDLPIGFNDADTLAYFSCNVPGGFGICTWDPATRQMATVWSNPKVTATGLANGPTEDRYIGVNFDDGRPGVVLFHAKSQDAQLLIALMQQFPGESVRFVSATRDGSKSIVKVDADTDPGTFYLFDRATRKLTPLLRNASWIEPQMMAAKQPFEFAARDGLKLQGYLSYPPGRENARHLPMVVYVHGGPYGVRDWWDYDPDVQAVATRGYVVLQVNYRGSGGYGYDFEKAGWLQWGGKMQDDVTDATRWAIAQGIADPGRICIYGGSYGGYAALEGAVKEPDLYKCAVGYVGIYDLSLMYKRGDIPESTYGKKYLERVLGKDDKILAQHSPIDQLDRLKARVMLIVGGEDGRVPAIQGQNMYGALHSKGIPCEWLYKPKETHGFYKEENVTELYTKVGAFLDANIGSATGSITAVSSTAH
ncbi:MAG TPA: S9 family peptidase [Rhodanobacteraceae bacterium]|nr:S9 family peptidase [Rhodanobacteraceae bacterium]